MKKTLLSVLGSLVLVSTALASANGTVINYNDSGNNPQALEIPLHPGTNCMVFGQKTGSVEPIGYMFDSDYFDCVNLTVSGVNVNKLLGTNYLANGINAAYSLSDAINILNSFKDKILANMAGATTSLVVGVNGNSAGFITNDEQTKITTMWSTYGAPSASFDVNAFMNNQASTTPLIATSTFNGFMSTTSLAKLNSLSTKRRETFSGTTNGSGIYTATYTAYSVAPNIQANILGGSDTQFIRLTSVSSTTFSVTVRNRTDVLGLLPTYANVSGASVDVLISEK